MHAGLASLVEREGANLEGRRILMYSYGSGLAASLWSVIGRRVEGKFALSSVSSKVCTLRIQSRGSSAPVHKLHMLTGSLLQRTLALALKMQSCSRALKSHPSLQTRIRDRLEARRKADPAEFVATLELLEKQYRQADYVPKKTAEDLREGTFYLSSVDALYRRTYACKS